MMFARKTSMLNTLLLILRLTVFVDQCDAGKCAVYAGLTDEDDAGPVLMLQSALPACAREGMLVNVASATCSTPRATPTARLDDGADIDLDGNTPAEPDHAKACPGDWLGHMDRPAGGSK